MQILTCSQFCPVVVRNALAWRIPNDGVFLIKLRLPPSQWWPVFLRMRLTGSRARPVQVKRAIGWLPVISSGLESDWLRMMALGGRRLWHRCYNVCCLWVFCRYICRRCCWAVEDSAPGYPHEAWGLNSSRRGNLCAVLVCVSTQGYTLTSIAIVACCFAFSYFDILRFWFLIVIPRVQCAFAFQTVVM